jgi:ankyrin repeat protein
LRKHMNNNRFFLVITLAGLCTLTHTAFAMEDNAGREALAQAIQADDPTLITEVIETYKIDVNEPIRIPKKWFDLPLEIAIYSNKPKAVVSLIQNGALVNSKNKYKAPMLFVASTSYLENPDLDAMIKLLIEQGADTSALYSSDSALSAYCQRPDATPEVMELLAQKIGVDFAGPDGQTALRKIAVEMHRNHDRDNRYSDLSYQIQSLLNLGANPNSIDASYRTPFDLPMIYLHNQSHNMRVCGRLTHDSNPEHYNRQKKAALLLLIFGAQIAETETYNLADCFTPEELAFVEREKEYIQALKQSRQDALLENTPLPAPLCSIIHDYDDYVGYDLRLHKLEGAELPAQP